MTESDRTELKKLFSELADLIRRVELVMRVDDSIARQLGRSIAENARLTKLITELRPKSEPEMLAHIEHALKPKE